MHEKIKAFSQKLHQFWKTPKKISKTQKLRLKIMKCMNMRDLDTYQMKKNLIKPENLFEIKFGVWERSLEGEKARTDWERSRKWRPDRAEQIYRCREVLSFKSFNRCSYREVSTAKQAQWIEEVSRGQELSQSIHLAIERCQDCDKKQLKSSTDRGVEIGVEL